MQIKKSLSIILLTILFTLVTAPQVFAVCECLDPENLTKTFAGGDGSSASPYVICNADQLYNIRTSLASSYVVKSNIDLIAYTNWQPIGNNTIPFTGTLDGQNFVISNLKIDRATTDYVGLFGYTASGSVIQNLKLNNVNVKGRSGVAALVGYNKATLNKISSSGSVIGATYVGGLIGWSEIGILSQLSSTCSVTATQRSGGLIGILSSGSLSDSYARGAVTCSTYNGGLLSSCTYGTVINTYSTGTVTATGVPRFQGGLVGSNSYCTYTSSYWDINTSGQTTSAGGTGKTTAEMKQQATFTGWDFSTIWSINENVDYPHLRMESLTGECIGYCGDGIVSGEEQCEQTGDCAQGSYCNNCMCIEPVCGNSIIEPGENCEQDGDCAQGSYCNNCMCTEPVCGNGLLEPGEMCEQDTDCGGSSRCTNCECVTVTFVTLSSFEAVAAHRKIILTWTTESEIDNAGFNIYRAESENGQYVKINTSLIPTEGAATQGASYEFIDKEVKNRKTYYYKLEDIDLKGKSTFHGPVSATPRLMYRFRK